MALHLPCKGKLGHVTNTLKQFFFFFLNQGHLQLEKRSQGMRKGQSCKVETSLHIRDFSS